jgi:hypothetical protein
VKVPPTDAEWWLARNLATLTLDVEQLKARVAAIESREAKSQEDPRR